jgi:uncharacterized membrane protein YeaQ/YmgE (transglycosylase-associated protein family)
MKAFGYEIKFGMNEVIIGAVIGFAALCFFKTVPPANEKLAYMLLGALVGWGATTVTNKKGEPRE